MTLIDICMCTFRRPHMVDALASLNALQVPEGHEVRVIVVDNDTEPTAKAAVQSYAETAPFAVVYLHRPAGNISIARNGALDQSDAPLMAFIDDDEVVTRDWLVHLVQTHRDTGAGVVLGPVDATYLDSAPGWMKRGAFHNTRPVWVKGQIKTGYTCNVLLDRGQAAFDGLRFDLNKGRTGGEDTDFFSTLFDRGVAFAYAAQALVTEVVPEHRAQLSWLAERRRRMGQTQAAVYYMDRPLSGRIKAMALSVAKAGFCMAGALLMYPIAHRKNAWYLRGMLHIGVLGAMLGGKTVVPYGLSDTTAN
ncbi:glycosyltransferase [Pseudaestuariivita rosea]|uniref:glycosyltransferase n=1 Tax=Pseudaestuariivita rosea TaxID=2763263 RepID=UPI001ABB70DD|nr:glycosyltransferase family 2 protein [Pseudaestuariivita rosea]